MERDARGRYGRGIGDVIVPFARQEHGMGRRGSSRGLLPCGLEARHTDGTFSKLTRGVSAESFLSIAYYIEFNNWQIERQNQTPGYRLSTATTAGILAGVTGARAVTSTVAGVVVDVTATEALALALALASASVLAAAVVVRASGFTLIFL